MHTDTNKSSVMVRRYHKRHGPKDGPHQAQGHACQRERTPCRRFCRLFEVPLLLLLMMMLLLLLLLRRRRVIPRHRRGRGRRARRGRRPHLTKLITVLSAPLGHRAAAGYHRHRLVQHHQRQQRPAPHRSRPVGCVHLVVTTTTNLRRRPVCRRRRRRRLSKQHHDKNRTTNQWKGR
jgi:hypothetical protein